MVDRERPGDVPLGVEREVAGDDVLRQLVAGQRGQRDRGQAEPLLRPRGQRAMSARERRQSVGRGADAHVSPARDGLAQRRSSRRLQSMQSVAHGKRCEALLGDLLAAVHALAVGALLDALERRVDRGQHVLRVLLERGVDLAVERLGRRVGEVVVGGSSSASSSIEPGFSLCRYSIASTTRRRSSSRSVAEPLDVDRHRRPSLLGSQAASAASSSPFPSSTIASAERSSDRIRLASPRRCSRSASACCLISRASACASVRNTSASRRA